MADIMNFWFLSSRPVPIAFRYPSPSSLWYQPSPQSLYDLFLAEQLAEAVIDVDTEERTTPPRRGASLPASGIVRNAKHTSLASPPPYWLLENGARRVVGLAGPGHVVKWHTSARPARSSLPLRALPFDDGN